ncbi:MAG: zinc ABC transporter substrate-binding protein [Gammaproteobacteria bacterium]
MVHILKQLLPALLLIFPALASGINIVSSISPVNALTDGVTQGITTSTLLVPPNVSHHHYTLKPSDARALQQADVVIWVGHSLETFLEKPITNLSTKTTVITLEDLPNLTLYAPRSNKNWGTHNVQGHNHESNIDPHLWLNPQNAIIIAKAIAETLSKIDVTNAKLYQANANDMIKKINELDKKLAAELAPVKDIPFLVFHDGYQYFEKYYHLNAVGSVSIDSDLPPSAQRLYQIHQQIQQEKIPCVFAEVSTSSAIITTLQRDTNIKMGELDSMGKGHQFADYLNLLQFDADQLVGCLRATK